MWVASGWGGEPHLHRGSTRSCRTRGNQRPSGSPQKNRNYLSLLLDHLVECKGMEGQRGYMYSRPLDQSAWEPLPSKAQGSGRLENKGLNLGVCSRGKQVYCRLAPYIKKVKGCSLIQRPFCGLFHPKKILDLKAREMICSDIAAAQDMDCHQGNHWSETPQINPPGQMLQAPGPGSSHPVQIVDHGGVVCLK